MKKPKIFIQDCGAYSDQILVICGASKIEAFRFLKKVRAKVSFSKWVLENCSRWDEDLGGKNDGLFCWNTEERGLILKIKPITKNGDWEYWEALMHEIHHIVFYLSTKKAFKNETENQAYLFEFIFRSIRRKIQGIEDWE